MYRLRIKVVSHGEIKTMGFIRSVITRLYTRATVRVVAGVLAIRNYLDTTRHHPHGRDLGVQALRNKPETRWCCTLILNPLSQAAFFQPAGSI